MENIDRDKLYADSEYRFTYVSNFMDFGKFSFFFLLSILTNCINMVLQRVSIVFLLF